MKNNFLNINKIYLSSFHQSCILIVVLFLWFPLLYIYGKVLLSLLQNDEVLKLIISFRSLKLLYNTFTIAIYTTLICVFISIFVAYILKKYLFKENNILKYVWIIPIFIPSHIMTMAWLDLFRKLCVLFDHVTLCTLSINFLGWYMTIFILSLSYYPYLVVFILAGMFSLDPSLEEAAKISMSDRKLFTKIVLPFLGSYILGGAILVFVLSAGNYAVPSLLSIRTYPIEIFSEFSIFFDSKRAIFCSFLFLLVIIEFALIEWWIIKKCNFNVLYPQSMVKKIDKIKYRKLLTCFLAVILILSVAIPVFWLIEASSSVKNYAIALKTAWRSILITLVLSAVSATIATAIGYVVAYMIARIRSVSTACLDALSIIILMTPGVIWGIGMIEIWNHALTSFVYDSSVILILGYSGRFLPFSIRCLISGINQIDSSLEEAYLICNERWLSRQKQIMAPLMLDGFLLSWILVFVLSSGELGATLLITPPGIETLSLRIYNLMHYGSTEIVATLSLVLIGLSILPVIIFMLWRQYDYSKRCI